MADSTPNTPSPPPHNIAYAVEERRYAETLAQEQGDHVEEEEEEDHAVSFSALGVNDDAHTDAEHASKREMEAKDHERRRRKRRRKAGGGQRKPPLVIVMVSQTQCHTRHAAAAGETAACLDPQSAHSGQDKAAHSVTLSLLECKPLFAVCCLP
jgi:hypothetical protein